MTVGFPDWPGFRERLRGLSGPPDDPLHIADRQGTWVQLSDAGQLHAGPGGGAAFPLAVKANIAVRGMGLSAGTPALRNAVAQESAGVVAACQNAGAVVVGTTNMHELAFGITGENSYLGPVRNPHDPARSAGGSSSGSAAAVARGHVRLALGSDTGGSVAIPAAHCGVVGFRPTTGRWPTDGMVGLSWTRDTPGVFAAAVGDVMMADAAITGTTRPPAMPPRRLAVPTDFLDGLDTGIADRFDAARRRLSDRADVIEISLGSVLDRVRGCEWELVAYESRRLLAAAAGWALDVAPSTGWSDLRRQVASPDVGRILDAVEHSPISGGRYAQAVQDAWRARELCERVLAESGADALVFPTTPIPPPELGTEHATSPEVFDVMTRHTVPGAVLRAPMLTLPLPAAGDMLPAGITVQGAAFDDLGLLGTGAWLESAVFSGRSRPCHTG